MAKRNNGYFRLRHNFLCLFPLCILLIACDEAKNSDLREPETEKEEQLLSLNGIWERKAYGDIVVINDYDLSLYQFTKATCLQVDEPFTTVFLDSLELIEVADDQSQFQIQSQDNNQQFPILFQKLDQLPIQCENLSNKNADVNEVFNHFWHNFNDYYAFFNTRNVNWADQYDDFIQDLNPTMSDAALFERFSKMITPLNDAHVVLSNGEQEFVSTRSTFEHMLQEEFAAQDTYEDFNNYVYSQFVRFTEILTTYIDEGELKHKGGPNDFWMQWGTIRENIGYFAIQNFEGFGPQPNATVEEEINVANILTEEVLTDLDNTRGLIIDLRSNSGGYDEVALSIASNFTDQKRLAFSKTTSCLEENCTKQDIYLIPTEGPSYSKPIVIITSQQTASAAEVFALAMRAIPNTTHIGEATQGIFSDMLEKVLPNGWMVSLSNEIYLDHNGISHEAIGIQPNINVSTFSLDDRVTGSDSAIEQALILLQ